MASKTQDRNQHQTEGVFVIEPKLPRLLKELWLEMPHASHSLFSLLVFIAIITSIAEIFSLGAIIPFVTVLIDPDTIQKNSYFSSLFDSFNIKSSTQIVVSIAIIFGLSAVLVGLLRLTLLNLTYKFTTIVGIHLGGNALSKTLYQHYDIHINKNSSEIISVITQKITIATEIITSVVTVITSAILLLSISALLIYVNSYIAIATFLFFGAAYLLVIKKSKRKLLSNSKIISDEQTYAVRIVQESLGSIRDILMDGTQNLYCEEYIKSIRRLKEAYAENVFINQAPRYLMETLGLSFVALCVLFRADQSNELAQALPMVGVFGLAAQRMLPLMQQIYGNWAVIAGSNASLIDALVLLKQEPGMVIENVEPHPFIEGVVFDNVYFRYRNQKKYVLEKISLTIKKGEWIGVIGTTGSGKSTFIDLLMGLIFPTQGAIIIDGLLMQYPFLNRWKKSIAHVPQQIFLIDGTIAQNIAFSIAKDKINLNKVKEAARLSLMTEFIEGLPNQYDEIIGERGSRLSGGQKQRLGIARALYKDSAILILDEATSALDQDTESAVMKNIASLSAKVTIIMVTHRKASLNECDRVITIGPKGVDCN